MLAVLAFIAFWIIMAIGLFFVASRGGLSGARAALHTQRRGARKGLYLAIAIVYVGCGVGLPIAFLTGNHANASSQVGGTHLNRMEKHGRALFGEHCAVCHTLVAANANGKVGPNLDVLKPPYSLVIHTIQYGCLQNPPTPSDPQTCLGQGVMPAQVVQGTDAEAVAKFVAKVAGRE
jgi:mono/diheme cytochrome c family protein